MFSDFVSFLCLEIEIIEHNEHNPEPHHSRDLIFCTLDHFGELTASLRFLMHTLLWLCVLCSCFWSANLPVHKTTMVFFASSMPSIHRVHLTMVRGLCQNASMCVMWCSLHFVSAASFFLAHLVRVTVFTALLGKYFWWSIMIYFYKHGHPPRAIHGSPSPSLVHEPIPVATTPLYPSSSCRVDVTKTMFQ